jgi:hypothetical protein
VRQVIRQGPCPRSLRSNSSSSSSSPLSTPLVLLHKHERGILCISLLSQLGAIILQSRQKEGAILLLPIDIIVLDPRFHLIEHGRLRNSLNGLGPLLLGLRVRLNGLVTPLVRLSDELDDELALQFDRRKHVRKRAPRPSDREEVGELGDADAVERVRAALPRVGQLETVASANVDIVVRAVDPVKAGSVNDDVELVRLPVLEFQTGRGDLGDRVLGDVDEGDVGLVEGFVVTLGAERATAVVSLGLEELGRFRILDDLSDLAANKGCRRLVRVDVRSEVAECLEEEPEPASLVPDTFVDFLALGLRRFEGRLLTLDESHGEKRVEHRVPDPVVVLIDLLLFFLAHRTIIDRDDVLSALLEDGDLLHEWIDGSRDLTPRRSGADDGDAFSGDIEAFGPPGRMEGEALEGVDSEEFWSIRVGQDSEGRNEVGRGKVEALIGRDVPTVAGGIIVCGDDFILEDIILEDVGFLGGIDDLLLEIFRSQVARVPLGRIAIVGEAIDPALGVGLSTGVLVPIPGPAEGAPLFDGDDGIETEFVLEEVDELYAAKSSADDESVDFLGVE